MIEIRPRDVVVGASVRTRGEQTVHHVRLTHKPTKLTVEGEGPTYESARTKADLQLQDALELTQEEEAAFS